MKITDLLKATVDKNASDLHLVADSPPVIRLNGEITRMQDAPIDSDELSSMLYHILTPEQKMLFEKEWEIDFAVDIAEVSRFRVNLFKQNRGIGAVFRIIPKEIPTLDSIDPESNLTSIAMKRAGLCLITGATGSGKSTTLAALIDFINKNRFCHILTIEDPIEFVHYSKKSLITQRELHSHTKKFTTALRSAMREDPDVILVGEIRDLDTMRLTLSAAETGHLVFGTLHTNSAPETINRVIDLFPGDEKNVARTILAESLQAVVSQKLVKTIDNQRCAAFEVMLGLPAIKNLIRENKIPQMVSFMQTGKNQGMQTLDQHLKHLVAKQVISVEEARENGTLSDYT